MILIPEQISYLREQREKLLERVELYNDYLQNKEFVSSDYFARVFIGDSFTDEQYHIERKNLNEVTEILSKGEYLRERQLDQIGIGTKFIVQFNGSDEQETIVLTDSVYGLTVDNGFVSVTSLLGENVLGKKIGSSFSYTVVTGRNPLDKRKISGNIIDIKQDPNDYVHFLTEKPKGLRMSKLIKRKLHELLNSSSKTAKEDLDSYYTITPSQRFILTIEKERLEKKKDPSSISRLAVVQKLLTSPVVTDIPEGIVTVGSKFDLIITGPDQQTTTRTYEMINNAVSDELEDAYVERISPLGSSIYGLREQETFTFRKQTKTYKGIISTIYPTKKMSDKFESSFQYRKK